MSRFMRVPPDTKGLGTPPSEILDDTGRTVGRFDSIDILRLRLTKWLTRNGTFSDGGPGEVPDEQWFDELADAVTSLPDAGSAESAEPTPSPDAYAAHNLFGFMVPAEYAASFEIPRNMDSGTFIRWYRSNFGTEATLADGYAYWDNYVDDAFKRPFPFDGTAYMGDEPDWNDDSCEGR